jgi:hypothetical protein
MSIYLSVGCSIAINFSCALYMGYMLLTTIQEIQLDGLMFFLTMSGVSWAGICVICFACHNLQYRVRKMRKITVFSNSLLLLAAKVIFMNIIKISDLCGPTFNSSQKICWLEFAINIMLYFKMSDPRLR